MEPNQTPQEEIQAQDPNKKILLAVVAILAIIAVGYLVAVKYEAKKVTDTGKSSETKPMNVTVKHTERMGGVLPAPSDFPQDIPIEKTSIIESATSIFPDLNIKQLTVSYRSKKTLNEKFTEYKNYMTKAGYTISEGDINANLKSLSGTKDNTDLTVVISKAEVGSTVQIAYLLK